MLEKLDGSTRVYIIVGDPIAQVKSPNSMTRAFLDRGVNAIVVPMHVTAVDLDTLMQGVRLAENVDGVIVTVPHKFAAFAHCAETTDRACILGAVNVIRRREDGAWYGDMLDGLGFVGGIRTAGHEPEGRRALLVGAGGAGSAIALALVDEGVAELAIHDTSTSRRDQLIDRLRSARPDAVLTVGTADPTGFDLVVNATPTGMQAGDPLPLRADRFTSKMFVADVITKPAVTPLIEQARRAGCRTQVGAGMFYAEAYLMLDFLLAAHVTCNDKQELSREPSTVQVS